jgi:carbamoylphosphate synthase small subunit
MSKLKWKKQKVVERKNAMTEDGKFVSVKRESVSKMIVYAVVMIDYGLKMNVMNIDMMNVNYVSVDGKMKSASVKSVSLNALLILRNTTINATYLSKRPQLSGTFATEKINLEDIFC